MQLTRKIATAVVSASLLFSSFATQAFADTTIEISGNGTSSDNDAIVTTTSETNVVQSNNAYIKNDVKVDADTGHNDANDNTGGDVTVDTGNVNTKVDVSTTVNSNTANVDCCQTGDTDVLISGNGSHSDNTVDLTQTRETNVFQSNDAKIKNDVDVDADTGHNNANDNTGGDVTVDTGWIKTHVDVSNSGNVNSAQVGDGTSGGGSVSAWITGNGHNSDNDILLALAHETNVVQSNNAYIKNDVDVDADTGHNDANDNTGGDVTIETGNIYTHVEIDNAVNFNVADVDCVCLLSDLLAKIAGNGSDSDNTIKAKLEEKLNVFQDNCGDNQEWSWEDGWHKKCKISNDVYVDSDTGHNDAEDNTGPRGHDPVEVTTGDVDTHVDLETSGNVNVFGNDGGLDLPDFDFDLHLSFDLSDLLRLLGLLG